MTLYQRFCLVLADGVLVVHFAFIAFVVLGLLVIWIGWWRKWAFVRGLWFRAAHLAAIALVAAQALLGIICPLTIWENQLRIIAGGEGRYAGSFVQHWLHQVIFFEAEGYVFTIAYVTFFLLVALSLWLVPPQRKRTVPPVREK
jgi:hypothetical protein